MYLAATTKTYRAVNCDRNSYGVNNETAGLNPSPCRSCANGLMTNATLTPQYFSMDGGAGGYTNPRACLTQPGFGESPTQPYAQHRSWEVAS
jgi:hypothetical protein